MNLISSIRDQVRSVMTIVARGLNKLSGGKLSPDFITLFGLGMHLPIALLIANDYLVESALLLAFFGLFDALDGALARVQGKSSPSGMLLDASTDRLKEVLIYSGAAYNLAANGQANLAYLAVLACGLGLCVSYIKAKGESAVATSGRAVDHAKLNRMFADGLASFDIRVVLVIIGLITDELAIALAVIAGLALYTALRRLYMISKYLDK